MNVRSTIILAAFLALLSMPVAEAACPSNAQVISSSCGDVAPSGCCSGGAVLSWCDTASDQVCMIDCGSNAASGSANIYCGWNQFALFYDCAAVPGQADPSGQYPYLCGVTTGGDCGSIGNEGCCDETGSMQFCFNGQIQVYPCQDNSDPSLQLCGWNNAEGFYDCTSNTNSDPSGAFPYNCPTSGCVPDCFAKVCGDNGCGGSCGGCPGGYSCVNNLCTPSCTPNCLGRECGPDSCGGVCGTCPVSQTCDNVQGQCSGPCSANCSGKVCGDDGCGGSCGSCAVNATCVLGLCVPSGSCTPDCAGKQCGSDGCGGLCGQCAPGLTCSPSGMCAASCVGDCNGKNCGDDGCGGSCGSCGAGQYCNNGLCAAGGCQPNCTGKECGDDGCGGSCGYCGVGYECGPMNVCQACQSSCLGKDCGDDGCGGSCGVCGTGETCSLAGSCIPEGCTPYCPNTQCGPDGCGGVCGVCAPNYNCVSGACVQGANNGGGPVLGRDWTDPCPPGLVNLYGMCVLPAEKAPGLDGAGSSSGCSSGAGGASWLSLLLGLLVLGRRRSVRMHQA